MKGEAISLPKGIADRPIEIVEGSFSLIFRGWLLTLNSSGCGATVELSRTCSNIWRSGFHDFIPKVRDVL
jgi:hypothetical protein